MNVNPYIYRSAHHRRIQKWFIGFAVAIDAVLIMIGIIGSIVWGWSWIMAVALLFWGGYFVYLVYHLYLIRMADVSEEGEA